MKIFESVVKHVDNQIDVFCNTMDTNKKIETSAKVLAVAAGAGIVAGVLCSPVVVPIAMAVGAYSAFSYCIKTYNPLNEMAESSKTFVNDCVNSVSKSFNSAINGVVSFFNKG